MGGCRAWVASRRTRRRLDWRRDSYAVLRTAAWELPQFIVPWRRPPEPGEGNGACWRSGPLIAAALDAGFRCDDWPGGGTYLNVGERQRPADKPKPPRARLRPGACDSWI